MFKVEDYVKTLRQGVFPIVAVTMNPFDFELQSGELRTYLKEVMKADHFLFVGEGDDKATRKHAHGLIIGGKWTLDNKRRKLKEKFKCLQEKGKGGTHPLRLVPLKEVLQIYYLCKDITLKNVRVISSNETLEKSEIYIEYGKKYLKLKKTKKKDESKSKLNKFCLYVKKNRDITKKLDTSYLVKLLLSYMKEQDINCRTFSSVDRYINYYLSEHNARLWIDQMTNALESRYL